MIVIAKSRKESKGSSLGRFQRACWCCAGVTTTSTKHSGRKCDGNTSTKHSGDNVMVVCAFLLTMTTFFLCWRNAARPMISAAFQATSCQVAELLLTGVAIFFCFVGGADKIRQFLLFPRCCCCSWCWTLSRTLLFTVVTVRPPQKNGTVIYGTNDRNCLLWP
jgi:hypothetical protein